jgi:DNA polymerase III delta prime subunit
MFFGQASEIAEIARKVGTSVFVVPKEVPVEIKNAIILQPEDKSVITIEQVRNVISQISTRQTSDVFVVIRPAEAMGEAAANAFLKSLEEPRERVHFMLITDSPSQILPTILSRAAVYFLRDEQPLNSGIKADEKVKNLAKRLMVAKPAELVDLAEEIGKKKDGVRAYALEVLGAAIEMLYKSYFITGKEVFVQKLPKFLAAYEGISKNGHVKLQIVSNLC